jgi:spore cortex formation protein SpoVR/YcgB (stage V sporulation)
MINSNVISNFMTKAFVERKEYFTRKKSNAYNLIIVDKNSLLNENERVNKKTKLLLIAI